MSEQFFGVIGGSGLYEMEGFERIEEVTIDTPFGPPSDAFTLGRLDGVDIVFLPRHGRGHRLTPSEVNYRANIWGLKSLGVRHVLSVSAVGSLKSSIEPGHVVCVDQFLDRTRGRPSTFFEDGIVGHVQFGDPVEEQMRQHLLASARASGAVTHDGGSYVCIEGPTFSTRAESELYRSWGCSVVGMTNLPEARLAREAELAYCTLALCTDYDCWHEGHDEVSVATVVETIRQNVHVAKQVIRNLSARLVEQRDAVWPAHEALAGGAAVMTKPALIPEATKARVSLLVGHYLWPDKR
ncbi:MAG: S-methyl-5'-thioadenosine phosphorylase [Myxococcota bacterium]|nr:S-methyl-5'-thioadenosine phosphorylase [Myxococcota bacterium]